MGPNITKDDLIVFGLTPQVDTMTRDLELIAPYSQLPYNSKYTTIIVGVHECCIRNYHKILIYGIKIILRI